MQNVCVDRLELKGLSISKGISIGKPFFIKKKIRKPLDKILEKDKIAKEITRYRGALRKSRKELQHLQKRYIQDGTSVVVEILDGHIEMLSDPHFTEFVENKIKKTQRNIESVFSEVITDYNQYFDGVDDEFLQERIQDIKDVSRRVLNHLQPIRASKTDKCFNGAIIIAKELLPSDAVDAKYMQCSAYITDKGGYASHAGIIARAKGIPYITNIDTSAFTKYEIMEIIVDGINGKIIINPKDEEIEKYKAKKKQFDDYFKEIAVADQYHPRTKDNVDINIFANIETSEEIDQFEDNTISGIGLFRSEYLILVENAIPSQKRQFEIYKDVLTKMKDKPVTIRLFDIGGDKKPLFSDNSDYSTASIEQNPALGLRAIRFLMKNETILYDQLKSLLMASAYGNLKILIPLVSDLEEVFFIKEKIAKIEKELNKKNVNFKKNIPLGCMIEVPSMAVMIPAFSKEIDFFSIGTNDLAQYVLALDRTNPDLSHLYDFAHPSMLFFLKLIFDDSKKQKKEVSICGEMAADPRFTKVLLGLGYTNFSVAIRHSAIIKHAIRNTDMSSAKDFSLKALAIESSKDLKIFFNKEIASF